MQNEAQQKAPGARGALADGPESELGAQPVVGCMIDRRGLIVAAGHDLWPLLGLEPQDVVGRRWEDLVHPGDLADLRVATGRLSPGERTNVSARVLVFGGGHRWLDWRINRLADASIQAIPHPVPAVGSELGDEFVRRLLESAPDAIVTLDEEARITSWNRGAAELYGYPRELAISAPISIIIPPDRRGEEYAVLAAILRGETIGHVETERIARDGRRVIVSLSLAPVRGEANEIAGVLVIARDVGERKRMERRLTYLAHHDPLTGLQNRTRFEEELSSRLREADESGRPGALLALDLDGFKLINDTYGHAAGDALLQRIARALDRHVRSADVVARMGGDEFAVVMSDIVAEQAARTARKLLEQLGDRWEGSSVSASIGFVSFDGHGAHTPSELLIAADQALYEAKHRGRNQVAEYTGHESDGLGVVRRIRTALDRGRLVVYAQPIVDLRSGAICHEELLVRMLGDDGELIPPSCFLPAAERFRMIGEIDRWVTARALEAAAAGRAVAVNLSGSSVSDHALMGELRETLSASGAKPEKIVFEITETVALERMDDAIELSRALAELGCRFALDDFGTGFFHFGLLKHLPICYLKIDAEFVRGLESSSGVDRHVVEAVVALARGFGQQTIAEGVESEATLEALTRHGIDAAQGFLLGRPRPLE